ncbi:MAG: hypothetical protein LUG99_06900 [Lachnospiraceae bacterium]|nr:hypothetical protein [Lachnospiraceae bacterium]
MPPGEGISRPKGEDATRRGQNAPPMIETLRVWAALSQAIKALTQPGRRIVNDSSRQDWNMQDCTESIESKRNGEQVFFS